MTGLDIALIAGFVVVFGLFSRRIERSPVTGPMLFVGFGLVTGTAGADVLQFDLDSEGVELLAETTLGLLLFADATRIDVLRLRRDFGLPARMLLLGLPLTIVIGTGLAALLFDVPIAIAALIAAILAPTDAALGEAIVKSEAVPARVRQSLNVESGLNDGVALPAVTVFVAIAADEDEFARAPDWIGFAAEQVGLGVLTGLAVGCTTGALVVAASRRGWMDGVYRQLAVLGVAMLAFTCSTELGGNGFVATFTAGLAFGSLAREECESVANFTNDVAHLLTIVSFIVFGAVVVGPALNDLDPSVLMYALASLALVRPVAIALSLIGSGLRLPTVAFLGWSGPRGLASILFGVIALGDAHGTDLDPVFIAMSWTVLLSIFAHGFTARGAARVYGNWWAGTGTGSTVESTATTVSRVRSLHRTD